jgi:hypothetical protein
MPPVTPVGSIPLSDLSDFALGHLSPEDSLAMLDRIENDPQASADLEFVIDLLNFARRNPLWPESNRTTL